jgi:myosin protein heavy chain
LTKVFFKAGILAELEERRDDYLADIFTSFQASCRRFVARRQAKKILHRAQAVRTLQRNARLYVQLRAWPWWPLFQRVRPLLAAARSDDELRRKEEELVAAKKRAEEEEKERARLEAIRVEMESAQAEMERSLAAERSLAVEKDALLARSQEREAALQDAVAAAEADYEQVSSQLERAVEAKKKGEERLSTLTEAYANQTKLVETLQDAQVRWKMKEKELASQTSVQTAEWERVQGEAKEKAALVVDLKRQLSELQQDRRREQERLNEALRAAEKRVEEEGKAREEARTRLSAVEVEARVVKGDVAALEKRAREGEEGIKAREAELVRLRSGTFSSRSSFLSSY